MIFIIVYKICHGTFSLTWKVYDKTSMELALDVVLNSCNTNKDDTIMEATINWRNLSQKRKCHVIS